MHSRSRQPRCLRAGVATCIDLICFPEALAAKNEEDFFTPAQRKDQRQPRLGKQCKAEVLGLLLGTAIKQAPGYKDICRSGGSFVFALY